MLYVDYVYEIIKLEFEGVDAIYKDAIIRNVGVFGLNALLEHNLLETCGVVNGRQLYALRA